ncbi:glycosyltransferase family 4 protein [Agromyces silvae]|uniref:glycosyltransferase family 4 protein n=1 Tax=Agromyces silvae TaxID=3388266 RepID=UPI00280BB743|nr:glycosyltransferase family 4 protein [Agromyces protaetiae]
MRIAVVNNFFPPRPGGSSHLADHLARAYAAAGHEVLVLTAMYQNAPAVEERDGFRINRIPAWTLPKTRFAANFDIGFTISPRVKRRVFTLLDEFAPDVIHQHGQFFDLTWLTGWWARSRRVPTLLSVHTRLESPLSRFNSAVYAMADTLLVAPLMRLHRPKVVVMDVLMDRYIRKRYRRSISGTVAIPVGVDPTVMRGGDGEAARSRLGLPTQPLILSVGHVIPQRSRIALVHALPGILERSPEARVVVVGGIYHDEFLKLAERLGVEHAIVTLGARPQREIPDLLAAADLEVHELEGEGFGTASLEALAAGTPVAAAVRPDNFLEFRIDDGEQLFIVPFVSASEEKADPDALAEVVLGILEDPNARERVSAKAQRFVEDHFAIERVAEAHLTTLEGLVRQPRR